MSNDPSSAPLPFDRVVLAGRTCSVNEFLGLPLSQRVRHILNREVTFLQGQSHVKASTALAGLRSVIATKSDV